MATSILIHRSTVGSAVPSLAYGELGVNIQDLKLWVGTNAQGGGLIALGGEGHALMLAPTGTQSPTGTYDFSNGTLRAATQNATLVPNGDTEVATTAYVRSAVSGGGSGLNFTGGDVTGTGTTGQPVALTIEPNVVELTMMEKMANKGFLGQDVGTNQNVAHLSVADAITLLALNAQTAGHIANFDTQVRTSTLNQMSAPTADVSLNNNRITSLLAPNLSTDAATKGYVDSVAQGLDFKESVLTATVNDIGTIGTTMTLNGSDFSNGTAPTVTDTRVLVKAQSTASENGLYTLTSTGGLVRAADANSAGDLSGGAYVWVEDINTAYVLNAEGDINIGSDAQTWSQFANAQLPGGGNLLAVQYGGTGKTALTANSLLVGNGTNPVNLITSASVGSVVAMTSSGPAFVTELGDANLTINGGTFS